MLSLTTGRKILYRKTRNKKGITGSSSWGQILNRSKFVKGEFTPLIVIRWVRLIVGELLLLFTSILGFRSAWTLLDE